MYQAYFFYLTPFAILCGYPYFMTNAVSGQLRNVYYQFKFKLKRVNLIDLIYYNTKFIKLTNRKHYIVKSCYKANWLLQNDFERLNCTGRVISKSYIPSKGLLAGLA